MDDITTCYHRYKLLNIPTPIFLPVYACPKLYKGQQSELFPFLEQSRTRKLSSKWLDGLAYVHIQIHLMHERTKTMPRGRQTQSNEMPEMIQFKLRPEELVEYEAWTQRKGFSFDNILAEALLDGIKVGVSFDAYNDCFIASFTPKRDTHVNIGSCLLSRSNTWQEAIALNAYKSQVIFNNKKWVSRKEDDNRG